MYVSLPPNGIGLVCNYGSFCTYLLSLVVGFVFYIFKLLGGDGGEVVTSEMGMCLGPRAHHILTSTMTESRIFICSFRKHRFHKTNEI